MFIIGEAYFSLIKRGYRCPKNMVPSGFVKRGLGNPPFTSIIFPLVGGLEHFSIYWEQ
jgi:hypothetical protein